MTVNEGIAHSLFRTHLPPFADRIMRVGINIPRSAIAAAEEEQ